VKLERASLAWGPNRPEREVCPTLGEPIRAFEVGGMHNLLAECDYDVPVSDVFRMMGYPDSESVSAPVREICRAQVCRLADLVDSWGGSRAVRIDGIDDDLVRLDSGRTLRSRRLARILRRATSVEICLATVGSRVTTEINGLVASGDMIEAMTLDAAASVVTSVLMAQLRKRVCVEALDRKCGATLPYGPGYTGWQIEDTVTLFSYLAAETLPVHLNEQLMMVPEKSLLNVIGIRPDRLGAPPEVIPCRLCDLARCSFRRAPYRPEERDEG